MKLFTSTTAFLGLLGVASSAAVPSAIPTNDTSPSLELRDNASFSLAVADCVIYPATAWEHAFHWRGQVNVGIWEYDHADGPARAAWSYSQDFFEMRVCGVSVNFYEHNGNFDFYRNGGDGTLLGTYYPQNFSANNAFQGWRHCRTKTEFFCYHS